MDEQKKKLSKNERVKLETLALYDQLSQDEEERKSRIDIRNKIIELNYTFFGYVASHTYIENTSVSYEDKFQTALQAFCEIWWWYRWDKKTSRNLAFTVYFKPRIGEMIERYCNEVKYSLKRNLCIKAADQVGKHWRQLRYEDLSKVNLPADEMNSLKAIFGAVYWADFEEHELYIPGVTPNTDVSKYIETEYDDIETLLINEMVAEERPLKNSDLLEISNTYSIPYEDVLRALPKALERLHDKLIKNLDD